MSARRLYLDGCAVQRPLDRLLTSRERSEAECVLLLLEAVERGRLDLVWSPVLTFETIRRGPPLRAEAAGRVRRLASHHVGLDDALVAKARALTAKRACRRSMRCTWRRRRLRVPRSSAWTASCCDGDAEQD
jgi:hypothetical protein